MKDAPLMSNSEWAAWYAALIATCSLLWQVYTWFWSGPKLRLDIVKEPVAPHTIEVRIRNTGSTPDTLRSVTIVTFKSTLDRLRRLEDAVLRRANGLRGCRVGIGEEQTVTLTVTREMIKHQRTVPLWCLVESAGMKRSIVARIPPNKPSQPKEE